MREFLMGLYLLHGEREFDWDGSMIELWKNVYIDNASITDSIPVKITKKGLKYLKNLDNE